MRVTIQKPFDCHLHLRDDPYLSRTVEDASHAFERAIVMPNLHPAVFTLADAHNYKKRIEGHINGRLFTPLMTLYLSENTVLSDIAAIKDSETVIGLKLYPKNITTNASFGVEDLTSIYPQLEMMERHGTPLLIHGEDTHPDTDIFDREKRFIDTQLEEIRTRFPKLKISLEHITTKDAVDYITQAPTHVVATITAHHLWINRNDVVNTKIHPHNFCLPIAKRRHHQEALIRAAISGNPCFFMGTDSAPHDIDHKETACGCAGIYTARHALALYATIFDSHKALDKLENFTSHFGAAFYQQNLQKQMVTLVKAPTLIESELPYGSSTVVPFMAQETLPWQVQYDE